MIELTNGVRITCTQPATISGARAEKAPSLESDVILQRSRGPGRTAIFGLGCWSSGPADPAQGYVFVLTSDGGAYVVQHDETNERYRPSFGLGQFKGKRGVGMPLSLGEKNTIHAECTTQEGAMRLTMNVNGIDVATLTDVGGFGPFRAVGFFAAAAKPQTEFEFRFDNFESRQVVER